MARRILLLLLWVTATCAGGCGRSGQSGDDATTGTVFGPGPRRIVVVSLDNLRADRLSCYGNDRPTSPFLDRMAQEGLRFQHATCPANWTLPSHMSLFTGLYPFRHGVVRTAHKLADSVPTLVELIQIAGFQTAAFTGGGYLQDHYGFGRGFDHYRAAPALSGSWPETLRQSREWLAQHAQEDVFLFLHTYEIHEPFRAPAEYVERFLPDPQTDVDGTISNVRQLDRRGATPQEIEEMLARYDAGILYTDDLLGQWYQSLEELGLTDNLLLIISSDHGEQFWEHGHVGHGFNFLGSELTDIPLIVRQPRESGGRVISQQVSFLDVMPTVLDAAGVPVPAALDGFSLIHHLTGGDPPARDQPARRQRRATLPGGTEQFFLCEGFHFVAAATESWKAVVPQAATRGKKLKESPRLYDRRRDPGEQAPLPLEGAAAEALRASLDRIWNDGPAAARPSNLNLDQETLRQLRALGYTH